MPLRSNGRLLIKHTTPQTFALRQEAGIPLSGSLATSYVAKPLHEVLPNWQVLSPQTLFQQSPWDAAHAAAEATGYEAYIEPDIFHEPVQSFKQSRALFSSVAARRPPDTDADGFTPAECNDLSDLHDKATYGPEIETSPAWHLESGFTGFLDVRDKAKGTGVRIAHVDTGYTPCHASTPANLLKDLARDFWMAESIDQGKPEAIDPGTQFANTMQPGHGTATLALLAGNSLKLKWGSQKFEGFIGGAPDASIIPIRVGPTVYHLYSSGLAYAFAWALKPKGDPSLQADVISLSHGGLPSQLWADGVNALYNAGTILVAASGDWFDEGVVNLPTHYTVYPAAFSRAVTAVGVTYKMRGYQTDTHSEMQGSFGPHDVMEKAAAGFTPNVAWMDFNINDGGSKSAFSMSGGGTSSSTPQIAAACALWLGLYKDKFEKNWKRVEACRLALFDSCQPPRSPSDMLHLGHGSLFVPGMLSLDTFDKIKADFATGRIKPMPEDRVSFALWRLLTGKDSPGEDVAAQMYETEVAQVVRSSINPVLRQAEALANQNVPFDAAHRKNVIDELLKESISRSLAIRLQKIK